MAKKQQQITFEIFNADYVKDDGLGLAQVYLSKKVKNLFEGGDYDELFTSILEYRDRESKKQSKHLYLFPNDYENRLVCPPIPLGEKENLSSALTRVFGWVPYEEPAKDNAQLVKGQQVKVDDLIQAVYDFRNARDAYDFRNARDAIEENDCGNREYVKRMKKARKAFKDFCEKHGLNVDFKRP